MKLVKLQLTQHDLDLLLECLRTQEREYRHVSKEQKWRDSELAMALADVHMLREKIQKGAS